MCAVKAHNRHNEFVVSPAIQLEFGNIPGGKEVTADIKENVRKSDCEHTDY